MATYFHGAPEIQPDGLQTLYLMNPGYVLSDAATPTNMFLLNPTMNSLNPMTIAHNPHPKQQHHLLGIPLQPMAPPRDPKQSVFLSSKYLKAAQQLLDEVVNVVKGIQACSAKGADCNSPTKRNWDSEDVGADFTAAERQELQMKKAKLVNMFDEVEQRYGQYSQQMQSVVSSFESVAGFGSARTYTALALQTISKQFRCLRDAISCQIRATSKRLGDGHCPLGGTKSAGSRLQLVDDHEVRQQRALQQLGIIQHKVWRPQRGLPERAVSVLRAWLFEHFLHPYPKDVDKHMLAKQTGLTRSQVSNWFINARVRLWKPMVEEMYSEEFKDKEQNDADGKDKEGDANEDSASKPSAQQGRSPTRTEQTDRLQTERTIPPSVVENHEALMQPCLKYIRSNQSMSVEMKPNTMSHRDLLMKFMAGVSGGDNGYHLDAGTTNHGGGFGGYSIGDLERFDHEQFAPRFSPNGVSLTLGLQHCDNLSISGTQTSYFSKESIPLGRRVDSRTESNDYCSFKNNPTTSQTPNDYESNNIQNRKRFAAQLLQDFVA